MIIVLPDGLETQPCDSLDLSGGAVKLAHQTNLNIYIGRERESEGRERCAHGHAILTDEEKTQTKMAVGAVEIYQISV